MNTKINASLESINVTEKNALEFMLFYNNNLIKRYICSQLKINHHLKPILEIMNYKGEISDPLDQIINNNPLLWEEIIKYDSKSKIYKLYDNDFFYQILNTSELIYDVEFNIKDKLKLLRSKLDNISKHNIITKKVINSQINELEQKLIDEKWEINHYYSDEETQKLWKSFLKETIHQIKLETKEISSINISDYMLEKVSINFYLEQLKKDIVLNYSLIMYIFANKDKNQPLQEILDEIISIFDESLLNEDKI